jgi:hypothetical protein
MELYKGLPLRTVEAINKEGVECIFGITTEIVNDLIHEFFISREDSVSGEFKKTIEEFDSSCMYAVPQSIFENEDDEEVLKYINANIDNNYKLD